MNLDPSEYPSVALRAKPTYTCTVCDKKIRSPNFTDDLPFTRSDILCYDCLVDVKEQIDQLTDH